MRTHWKAGMLGVAAMSLVLLVAGCTSSGSSTSAASGNVSGFAGVAAAAATEAGSGVAAAGAAAAPTEASSQASGSSPAASGDADAAEIAASGPVDRQVIRTATVALGIDVPSTGKGDDADQAAAAKKVGEVAVQVRALVGSQGFVSAESGQGDTDSITLRVPTTGYDTAMAAVVALGVVTSRTEQAQDVTAQMVDLTSRVASMKASVDRIRTLLSQATKIGDVISIESELSSREADLESLERQQTALSGQVSLSTIAVTLQGNVTGVKPPVAVAAVHRTGFGAGLAGGWKAMKGFLLGIAAFLGAIVPWAPVLIIVAAVAIWWRRRVTRRSVVPALAPAAATTEE